MGQLGELSPAASIAVGILVGLLSTSIQSIGLTLQRKSHLLEDSKEDELVRRPPYRRRRWQVGMLMFIIANIVGSTIQITTLPLPVLSTLQASGLVFNTICATIVLGEPFTKWSIIGTVLVAGGAALIALFGALPEPSHTLDQLLQLLARGPFIAWMVCTLVAMLSILVLASLLARLDFKKHQRLHHYSPRIRLLIGMAYGCVSAILSAHSLLVAKSAVELLVRTVVDRVNQFNRFPSWLILLSLLCLALTQLYFLHKGLKLVSTSILYPFVFCVYNIIAILDGLIYFHQTDRLPPLHAGLISLGTIILLSGVLALSWRLGDEEDSSVPSTEPHTFLTPGMGIIEDTTTDDEATTGEVSPTSPVSEDEEAILQSTEQTPLLKSGRVMTPTSKDNAILRLTKHRRQRAASRGDNFEIWDALEDRERSFSGRSIRHGRRSSTMSAPRRLHGIDSGDDDEVAEDSPSRKLIERLPTSASLQRISSGKESELGSRRTLLGKRNRRATTPTAFSTQSRSDGMTLRGRLESLQDAIASWWRSDRSQSYEEPDSPDESQRHDGRENGNR